MIVHINVANTTNTLCVQTQNTYGLFEMRINECLTDGYDVLKACEDNTYQYLLMFRW